MVEKYAFCFFFLTVTSAVGIGFLALDCVIIMVIILEEGSVVGFEFYYLFIYFLCTVLNFVLYIMKSCWVLHWFVSLMQKDSKSFLIWCLIHHWDETHKIGVVIFFFWLARVVVVVMWKGFDMWSLKLRTRAQKHKIRSELWNFCWQNSNLCLLSFVH